ncbi:MAG: SRPBCC domain-containing protein [Pseudomonadota bacterium]
MTKPDYVMQTYIRCSLDALWDALTDPEEIKKYHFITEFIRKEADTTVYDFAPGAPMLRCRDIKLDPKTRIEQTFEAFWENAGPPSRFVYLLKDEGDQCSLTLEHYELGAPAVPGEGVADGWVRLLAGLKTYLETGQPTRFTAAAVAGGQ